MNQLGMRVLQLPIKSLQMFFDGAKLELGGLRIFTGSRPWVEANGVREEAVREGDAVDGGCVLLFPQAGLAWQWRWRCEDGRLLLESELENRSDRPVSLGRLAWVGASDHWLKSVEPSGCLALETPFEGRGYYRQRLTLDDPKCWHASGTLAQFWEGALGRATQLGFLTFQKTLNVVSYGDDLTMHSDYAGWTLAPGARVKCEFPF